VSLSGTKHEDESRKEKEKKKARTGFIKSVKKKGGGKKEDHALSYLGGRFGRESCEGETRWSQHYPTRRMGRGLSRKHVKEGRWLLEQGDLATNQSVESFSDLSPKEHASISTATERGGERNK